MKECTHNHKSERTLNKCSQYLNREWCDHGRTVNTVCLKCFGKNAQPHKSR